MKSNVAVSLQLTYFQRPNNWMQHTVVSIVNRGHSTLRYISFASGVKYTSNHTDHILNHGMTGKWEGPPDMNAKCFALGQKIGDSSSIADGPWAKKSRFCLGIA